MSLSCDACPSIAVRTRSTQPQFLRVIVGVHVLLHTRTLLVNRVQHCDQHVRQNKAKQDYSTHQSICTDAFDHSRVNTPLLAAVSLHRP